MSFRIKMLQDEDFEKLSHGQPKALKKISTIIILTIITMNITMVLSISTTLLVAIKNYYYY